MAVVINLAMKADSFKVSRRDKFVLQKLGLELQVNVIISVSSGPATTRDSGG